MYFILLGNRSVQHDEHRLPGKGVKRQVFNLYHSQIIVKPCSGGPMCPPIVQEVLMAMRAHTRVRPYKKFEKNIFYESALIAVRGIFRGCRSAGRYGFRCAEW